MITEIPLVQPPTRNVRRLQASIVKAASRVPIRALERLERAAGKLARRVLRGGGDSNAASLPNSFVTSVPRQITESSQTNWKGMGVEPDVKVSANEALKTVRLAAVNKVAEKTSDDRRRDQLKELSQTLQKELDHLKIPLQMIQ